MEDPANMEMQYNIRVYRRREMYPKRGIDWECRFGNGKERATEKKV